MKKKKMAVLIMMGAVGIAGCGAVDAIKEEAREQIEWTEENKARTNGMSAEEAAKDAIEDILGEEAESVGGAEGIGEADDVDSVSDANTYYIGDTASMKLVEDGSVVTTLDVTVTGYQQVYDRVNEKNATAIFYTVTSKDGEQMKFGNPYFTVYADGFYVEPGYWEDYGDFSYGVLMPGTTYDGCYVADVDPYLVSNIDLYVGDIIWHIQKEETPVQVNSTYDASEGLLLSGFYTDGNNSCSVSFYSYQEGYYVGTFSVIVDGIEYSGEMQYDENEDIYYGYTENLDSVCLLFSSTEQPTVIIYLESEDGSVDTVTDSMTMTQHYVS